MSGILSQGEAGISNSFGDCLRQVFGMNDFENEMLDEDFDDYDELFRAEEDPLPEQSVDAAEDDQPSWGYFPEADVHGYAEKLQKTVLPSVETKLQAHEGIRSSVKDLTKGYCDKAGFSSDMTVCLDTIPSLLKKEHLTETEVKVLSLYVLSAVYHLAVAGGITSREIEIRDNAELGFKGSMESFRDAFEYCQQDVRSVEDLRAEVSQRLGVSIGSCTVEEYFKNHVYVKDLSVIERSVVQSDNEATKANDRFLDYFSNAVNVTVKDIGYTYSYLFSSGYQVIKPVGVLIPDGILSLRGTKTEIDDSVEASTVFDILCNRLNYVVDESRDFAVDHIIRRFQSHEEGKLYFPYKMLEFAFGCCTFRASDGQGYSKSSDIASWSVYWEKQVKPQIVRICENTVLKVCRLQGYLEDERYRSSEHKADCKRLVDSLMEYLYKNLTACMLVGSWRKVEGDYIGFKVRGTDIEHEIPLDISLPKEIIDKAFNGYTGEKQSPDSNGSETAVLEPTVCLGASGEYTVIDIQHKFKPAIVNAEPLFAYRALDSVKTSGKQVSWKNVILGRRDDDSILSTGAEINFKTNFFHWIIAGSRSGKGVMTLNLLAAAISGGRPIFYLDNKPDMASMFRSSRLSGGKMFCVNADYDASFDELFQSCDPEKDFHWNRRLPGYVSRAFDNSYANLSVMYYIRAVMFMYCMIYTRDQVRSHPELFARLGGTNGVVCVIDEITAGNGNISAALGSGGFLGRSYYSTPTLNNARKALKEGKKDKMMLDEFGCYSTDFIESLNSTMLTLNNWKQKGLKGGGREGEVSDIFVLGQEMQDADTDKVSYKPTNDNKMNATCGDPFWNFMFDFGTNDGFFGYNAPREGYLGAKEEGSRARTRLSASARNFAYVKNLTTSTLRDIISDRDVRKSLSVGENALYFKPFLILNDGGEDTSYVNRDLRSMCAGAGLDFEQIKDMNRVNGRGTPLRPEMGFIPYIQAQGGSESVQDVLRKSYDIGNALVQAMVPGYEGDCVDFIYDLRPEAMFTANSMVSAFLKKKPQRVCSVYDEFFGEGSRNISLEGSGGTDFNDYHSYVPRSEREAAQEPSPNPKTASGNPEAGRGYQEPLDGKIQWTHEFRMQVARYITDNVVQSVGGVEHVLFEAMVYRAYEQLKNRGY